MSEGWSLFNKYCAEARNDEGWYFQRFDPATCPTGTNGAQDAYTRWMTEYNGEPQFFLEFHVYTDGDRSEIPRGAPVAISIFNFYGINYNLTIASDIVEFVRDVKLPIWFVNIEAGIPHTYRIELYPDRYVFYIDTLAIDSGAPEGPFPAHDARITWVGSSWELPCKNAWDYIRYGVIPTDGRGDYDSDGAITSADFYFFHECLSNQRLGINGGPDNDAGPGCRFADFDSDGDTDLLDVAEFQNAFSGTHP